MRHLYMVISAAAISVFSYAQHQGMALYTGGDSQAQQNTAQRATGGSSGSGRISHK